MIVEQYLEQRVSTMHFLQNSSVRTWLFSSSFNYLNSEEMSFTNTVLGKLVIHLFTESYNSELLKKARSSLVLYDIHLTFIELEVICDCINLQRRIEKESLYLNNIVHYSNINILSLCRQNFSASLNRTRSQLSPVYEQYVARKILNSSKG